jgi:hypothetical protein
MRWACSARRDPRHGGALDPRTGGPSPQGWRWYRSSPVSSRCSGRRRRPNNRRMATMPAVTGYHHISRRTARTNDVATVSQRRIWMRPGIRRGPLPPSRMTFTPHLPRTGLGRPGTEGGPSMLGPTSTPCAGVILVAWDGAGGLRRLRIEGTGPWWYVGKGGPTAPWTVPGASAGAGPRMGVRAWANIPLGDHNPF